MSVLLTTLPADSNALRLRLWRAVKALGCAALRDGVFLLPESHIGKFEELGAEVTAHGGTSWVLTFSPRSQEQATKLLDLFDRRDQYSAWRDELDQLRVTLDSLDESTARKRFRSAQENLATLQRIDYFPGPASQQASEALSALHREIDQQFSGGEPSAHAGDVQLLHRSKYLGKTWATRARPWVDRLACGWFVRRFVDADAKFTWLKDAKKVPKGIVGFDYDGAAFSHIGALVTFEVMVASFGFQGDSALRKLATVVHFLDVGGIPVADAAGLETILGGLREMHVDDDELLAAACVVFDGLYVAARKETS
jgi:hypothetical protein